MLLCVALIGGQWGFPAWGIAGAGWATVVGSWAAAMVALGLMLRPRYRKEFATDRAWRFEPALFLRLLRFGLPNGLMVALDGLAFLLFTILIGRMGPVPLAATSVTFTLNALAFLPAMGVAQAVEVLVGRRLGEDRPDLAERTTCDRALAGMRLHAGRGGGVRRAAGCCLLWPFANVGDPDWPAVAAEVDRAVAIRGRVFDLRQRQPGGVVRAARGGGHAVRGHGRVRSRLADDGAADVGRDPAGRQRDGGMGLRHALHLPAGRHVRVAVRAGEMEGDAGDRGGCRSRIVS